MYILTHYTEYQAFDECIHIAVFDTKKAAMDYANLLLPQRHVDKKQLDWIFVDYWQWYAYLEDSSNEHYSIEFVLRPALTDLQVG